MQQSKRTAAARVILGTPQSIYFWSSIGLRWPKRKGAAEHCAYAPIAARPQPTVWAEVGRISQIGHPCRSAVLAPSPLCPRVGQSRRTTMFAMYGLAPIAAVMQCHDRSKSANNRLLHPSRSESAEVA